MTIEQTKLPTISAKKQFYKKKNQGIACFWNEHNDTTKKRISETVKENKRLKVIDVGVFD